MKVLLLKDVYKLGRAGDVKKVADGYGRNFLLPMGLATLATPGMLQQVDHIRTVAVTQRQALNQEMSGVAELLAGKVFVFASKAGETGKLYGSITTQMVADTIQEKHGIQVDRHQIICDPIRTIGEHKAHVRLTVDLIPEIKIVVHREGEAIKIETPAEQVVETVIEAEKPAAEEPSAPAEEAA